MCEQGTNCYSVDHTSSAGPVKISLCVRSSTGHLSMSFGEVLFTVSEITLSISNILGQSPVYVGGISDCLTATLRAQIKRLLLQGVDIKTRALYLLGWLRSWLVAPIEDRILEKHDLILVQTEKERKWLSKISHGRLDPKTVVLPNGVNDDLFSLPPAPNQKNILILAPLSGGYKIVLSWILRNVWPLIKHADKYTKLFVVSRDASPQIHDLMKRDSRIIHIEYLPDIRDVFSNKSITLSPVFKGYGLINKVIESMAAGVPVIGDLGSFNGISGFENGVHGIISHSAEHMAMEALRLLNSPQEHMQISRSARDLVRLYFSWDDRIHRISTTLHSTVSAKRSIANKAH